MTQASAAGRRPRDRRQQIIRSAAEQFRAYGWHNVGITEIADAVGITSAALYRHFGGKQDLLRATLEDAFERLTVIWGGDYADLDELLAAACANSLQRRETGVLWQREVGHLPAEAQEDLRARFLAAVPPVRAAIGAARPDLGPDDVDLLLWATLGVLVSPGYHSVKLETSRFQARLVDACRAVCRSTPAAADDASPGPTARSSSPGRLLPASRQEAIVVAAIRLFSTRGYQNVAVEDIGAAAGITGPTVYHHFPSKSAILALALTRLVQAMFFDLTGVLNRSSTPAAALQGLLSSFVRTSIDQGQVFGALLDEVVNLPEEERRDVRRAQIDYLAEWVALLGQHRPDLPRAELQVLVQAAWSVVNGVLAVPHLRRRPALDVTLVRLASAILGLERGGPSAGRDPQP